MAQRPGAGAAAAARASIPGLFASGLGRAGQSLVVTGSAGRRLRRQHPFRSWPVGGSGSVNPRIAQSGSSRQRDGILAYSLTRRRVSFGASASATIVALLPSQDADSTLVVHNASAAAASQIGRRTTLVAGLSGAATSLTSSRRSSMLFVVPTAAVRLADAGSARPPPIDLATLDAMRAIWRATVAALDHELHAATDVHDRIHAPTQRYGVPADGQFYAPRRQRRVSLPADQRPGSSDSAMPIRTAEYPGIGLTTRAPTTSTSASTYNKALSFSRRTTLVVRDRHALRSRNWHGDAAIKRPASRGSITRSVAPGSHRRPTTGRVQFVDAAAAAGSLRLVRRAASDGLINRARRSSVGHPGVASATIGYRERASAEQDFDTYLALRGTWPTR